jgi:hypothetical protein
MILVSLPHCYRVAVDGYGVPEYAVYDWLGRR